MAEIFTAENMIALLTLASLEIVLGIDNLVFIAILTESLPEEQRSLGRKIGLAAALVTRLLLLFSISWIAGLTEPLFVLERIEIHGEPFAVTGQTLVLLVGGLFLMWKATTEIYAKVELHEETHASRKARSFGSVILNIALMDIVFSLDSVITAVGMADELWVMVGGVVIAMIVMILFADPVSNFINGNPSLKILALSFLLMIGTLLTAEALMFEIPKGFVYFAMAFSLGVDLIQMRYEANLKKKETPEAA